MIPKGYAGATDPNLVPSADGVERMMKFNEQLAKSGVLLALDGLHPPASAVRVRYDSGKPVVNDGPFTESKEIVGGYWMIQTKSKDEAVEWAKRIPADKGDIVEVRQVFEMSDFPADVQAAADSEIVKTAIAKK
jgi:hypothetical protein